MTYFLSNSNEFKSGKPDRSLLHQPYKEPQTRVVFNADSTIEWSSVLTTIQNCEVQSFREVIVDPLVNVDVDNPTTHKIMSGVFNKLVEPKRSLLSTLWSANSGLLAIVSIWTVHLLVEKYHKKHITEFKKGNGLQILVPSRRSAEHMIDSLINLLVLNLDTVCHPVTTEVDYKGNLKEESLRSDLTDWHPRLFALNCTNLETKEHVTKLEQILDVASDTVNTNRQFLVWSMYGKELNLNKLDKYII